MDDFTKLGVTISPGQCHEVGLGRVNRVLLLFVTLSVDSITARRRAETELAKIVPSPP